MRRARSFGWFVAASLTVAGMPASFGDTDDLAPERPSPVASRRMPVPSDAQVKGAIAAIHDIYRNDFAAANTPEKRGVLAQQLLAQAERTSPSADRWGLLVESLRLAVEAGDARTTFAVIDETTRAYAVDPIAIGLDAVGKLIPKVSPQTADDLTLTCLEMCRTLVGTGDLAEARKLLAMTGGLTKKSRNRALAAEVTKLSVAIRDAERVAKEREGMLGKLAAHPNDPEMALEAGSYLCFKAGDWDAGLPLVAKGSDAALARLAKSDLAARGLPERAAALGDAWWTWAEGQKGALRSAGLLRASFAYETALAHAQGLDKVRLERRIREAHAGQPVTGRRTALADVPETASANIFGGLTKNGTFQGKPFTCRGQPWPKGLAAHIADTAKQYSSITYAVPRGSKRLVGTAGIFTADVPNAQEQKPVAPQVFEVVVDGRTAWKSPPLSERDQTADFDVELHGARDLELRVWSESFLVAWAAWLNPEIVF